MWIRKNLKISAESESLIGFNRRVDSIACLKNCYAYEQWWMRFTLIIQKIQGRCDQINYWMWFQLLGVVSNNECGYLRHMII